MITIPKLAGLRLRLLQDPKLFRKLAQLITRVLRRQLVNQLPLHRNLKKELKRTAKPGILLAQHSFSSDLSFHPHWHAVVSDGVFESDGAFNTLWHWDAGAILEDLRTAILQAFVRWSRLSPEVADTLRGLAAERSGFSCFVGPVIPAEDREGLGRLIKYLFRSPVSYRQLEYDETRREESDVALNAVATESGTHADRFPCHAGTACSPSTPTHRDLRGPLRQRDRES